MIRLQIAVVLCMVALSDSGAIPQSQDAADDQNAETELSFTPDCSTEKVYHRGPNCTTFYQCSNGIAHIQSCPDGLYFNEDLLVCDWPSNVDCTPPEDRCTRRRIGRISGPGDDAESSTSCPRGFVPVGCLASNPRYSDGTYVVGRRCFAVNSALDTDNRPNGQRALATCVRAEENEIVFVSSGPPEANPRAECPSGYRVLNCLMWNPYSHVTFAFHSMDAARSGTCSSDVRCDACSVQAVCRLRTLPAPDDIPEGSGA